VNTTHIAKARRFLAHAGTPQDRSTLSEGCIHRLENDLAVLKERKESIRADFRRRLERWRTEAVPENIPVHAIPTETHDSRLYKNTGLFALAGEMGLAAWIFHRLDAPWWLGASAAVCITYTLHGVFRQLFDNPERPKEIVHRLRAHAILPAALGLLIALALAMLARYVSGDLAYMLLPLFSFALWLGTLSLLVLAACLFTLAHVLGWSVRLDQEYHALDAEERACADFLKELRPDAGDKPASPPAPETVPPSKPDGKPADGRHAALLGIAVLLAASFANTGCASAASKSLTADTSQTSAAPQSAADLHIYIDASGSCLRAPMEEAWHTLKAELPAIIQSERIAHVTISHFDEDGWCPRQVAELALPRLTMPPRTQATPTEWESFKNIRDAVRDAKEKEWKTRKSEAEDAYRASLRKSLEPIESETILPGANQGSRSTDIAGLLRRIAQSREPGPQFVLILTDLADTQYRALPKIPPPAGNIRVLALIVPSTPEDAILTIGKPLSGAAQYAVRRRELARAAPWITPAPYFARNLESYFKKE
jgi:hypothetical protein